MVLDYFFYGRTYYGEGDNSIRYYPWGVDGTGPALGVITLNVQKNVGELNQTVPVITSMEIDGMLAHLSQKYNMGEKELVDFVNELSDHAVMVFMDQPLDEFPEEGI